MIMADPKHIAIILDGNRRFARRLMAKPWKGHEFGNEKIKKLLGWCSELEIREVTLYAWSVENYPGFKNISGHDLIKKLMEQVEALGVGIKTDDIHGILKKSSSFAVNGNKGYEAKAVILALGTKKRALGVEVPKDIQEGDVLPFFAETCKATYPKDIILWSLATGLLRYSGEEDEVWSPAISYTYSNINNPDVKIIVKLPKKETSAKLLFKKKIYLIILLESNL